jgi:gliding motility-associated lipoprotein GldH
MQKVLYFFALASLLTSCGPTIIYEEEKKLPETGWAYQDSARFDFFIPDVTQAYDLILKLEHGATFPYQNFYVKLHTGFPSGKRATEQLSLQLAGDFGAWIGDCNSAVCDQEISILQNAKFVEAGDYYLTVEQFSREPALGSVVSVGLAVQETSN